MSAGKDGTRRVLPNVSVHPEFLGRTYIEWGKMALPTIAGLYLTMFVLPGAFQLYGIGLTITIAASSVVAILGSPGHLTAGEFIEQRINYHVRQPAMLHDRHHTEREESDQ
jgi:hypothetical protein